MPCDEQERSPGRSGFYHSLRGQRELLRQQRSGLLRRSPEFTLPGLKTV
jgi:hypothetical protein